MKNSEFKKSMEESFVLKMDVMTREDQENGIFKSRYEYGEEELIKLVRYRRRKLISAETYRIYISIIEKHYLF